MNVPPSPDADGQAEHGEDPAADHAPDADRHGSEEPDRSVGRLGSSLVHLTRSRHRFHCSPRHRRRSHPSRRRRAVVATAVVASVAVAVAVDCMRVFGEGG